MTQSEAIELADPLDSLSNYAVTSCGRVFSRQKSRRYNPTGEWKEIAGHVTSQGYRSYAVRSPDGPRWEILGHRLVASTFIGPIPTGMYVCHANGDRLDNRVENLRIDTPRGNSLDRVQHGTEVMGSAVAQSKLTEEEVEEIFLRLRAGEQRKALALEFAAAYTTVRDIDKGYSWAWLTSTM